MIALLKNNPRPWNGRSGGVDCGADVERVNVTGITLTRASDRPPLASTEKGRRQKIRGDNVLSQYLLSPRSPNIIHFTLRSYFPKLLFFLLSFLVWISIPTDLCYLDLYKRPSHSLITTTL
jgi:hypothetical protein